MSLSRRMASRRRFLAGLTLGSTGLIPNRAHSMDAAQSAINQEDLICILTPQSEEGPFYLDPKLTRVDITDGRDGVPLRLRLRIIEAGPCTPVAGARIDVWHCDAHGLYSGYPGQGDDRSVDTSGQTFLRGTQITDAGGWATFITVYPGWYAGRATHIHFKAFLDDRNVLMGQMYFPDALNEFIYTNVPAYIGRTVERSVINANDGVANEQDPHRRAFCAIKEEEDCYLASLTLGVNRSAGARSGERNTTEKGRPEWPGPSDRPNRGEPPGGVAFASRKVLKNRLAALIPGFLARRSK